MHVIQMTEDKFLSSLKEKMNFFRQVLAQNIPFV